MKPILHWAPRALGVAFVALTLFLAGDAFSESATRVQDVVAIAMHLVPTAIAVGLLIVAWEWEVLGGVLYLTAAIGYAAWVASASRPLSWTMTIAAPLFVTGLLFVIDQAQLRRSTNVRGSSGRPAG